MFFHQKVKSNIRNPILRSYLKMEITFDRNKKVIKFSETEIDKQLLPIY